MFPSWRRSTRILYILFPGQQVCHLSRMNFQGLRKNFHCPFGSPFLIGILFPSKKASLCGKTFSCLSSGATLKRSEDIARSLTSFTTQQLGWNTAGWDGIRMVFSLSLFHVALVSCRIMTSHGAPYFILLGRGDARKDAKSCAQWTLGMLRLPMSNHAAQRGHTLLHQGRNHRNQPIGGELGGAGEL